MVGNYQTPKIPDDCPESLSELMTACWNVKPEQRPSFKNIVATLERLKNAQVRYK
jgi:hypothetical protein